MKYIRAYGDVHNPKLSYKPILGIWFKNYWPMFKKVVKENANVTIIRVFDI